MKNHAQKPIILFDGVCNLCNSSVLFIIKHDTNFQFKFTSLQSDVAKEILLQENEKKNELNSIVLIYRNVFYYKSSAVLQIGTLLGGVFHIAYIGYLIPKPIRDFIYDIIAKQRYSWFGKKKSCLVPSKEISSRFIN